MTTFRITCEACPTQAQGRTVDDRAFYFRYRWGKWTLSVSPVGGLVAEAVANMLDGVHVAAGELGDGLSGYMDPDDVRAIVMEHLTIA